MKEKKVFWKCATNYGNRFSFYCPACNTIHEVDEGWNVDVDALTIHPSILVTGHNYRCHSFVKHGEIKYLNDCSHDKKGETIKLPEFVMFEDPENEGCLLFERPEEI